MVDWGGDDNYLKAWEEEREKTRRLTAERDEARAELGQAQIRIETNGKIEADLCAQLAQMHAVLEEIEPNTLRLKTKPWTEWAAMRDAALSQKPSDIDELRKVLAEHPQPSDRRWEIDPKDGLLGKTP